MVNDPIKIKSMQVLLKNPKMAKLVFAAMKAKPGSTKRSEAKNVLDAFYTAHLNKHNKEVLAAPYFAFQGHGGPMDNAQVQQGAATMGDIAPMPTGQINGPQSMPARFAPKPVRKPVSYNHPQPVRPFNEEIQKKSDFGGPNVLSPAYQGHGGPSDYDGKGGDLPNNTTYNPQSGSVFGKIGGFFSNLFSPGTAEAAAPQANAGPGPLNVVSSPGPQPNITVNQAPTAGTMGPSTFNPQGPTSSSPQGSGMSSNNFNPQGNGASASTLNFPGLTQSIQQPTPVPQMQTPDTSVVNPAAQDQNNAMQTYGSTDTSGQSSGSTGAGAAGTYTLNPQTGLPQSGTTGDPIHDYILQQIEAGMPADQVALGIMADSKKMQEIFPGVPVDQIPIGASLSGQLNDLSKRLKEQDGFTQAQTQLNDAIANKDNITEMTQSYIRGKDTYLQQVNNMLIGAQDEYFNSGQTDNPFYQKTMGNYINYLTILKGRTTQRYTDFVNQAITYQNNQVGQLTNLYNTASNNYNQDYRNQATLTVEEYTQAKQTLVDMYNSIAKQNGIIVSTGKAATDSLKTNADSLKSVLDTLALVPPNQRAQLAQNMGATNILNGVNLSSLGSKAGVFGGTAVSTVKQNSLNANVFPNYTSPLDALGDPAVAADKLDPGQVTQAFGAFRGAGTGKGTIDNQILSGNLDQALQQDIGTIQQMKNTDPAQFGATAAQWDQTVQSYINQLANGYQKGIDAYVQTNGSIIQQIVQSMTDPKYSGNFAQWQQDMQDKINNEWSSIPPSIMQDLLSFVDGIEQTGSPRGAAASADLTRISESIVGSTYGQLNGSMAAPTAGSSSQSAGANYNQTLDTTPASLINSNPSQ